MGKIGSWDPLMITKKKPTNDIIRRHPGETLLSLRPNQIADMPGYDDPNTINDNIAITPRFCTYKQE
jgi:hypothetical protein